MRPEPAFRRLPRAVREQQMLDAAVAVFSQHGYHAAAVDEIAEAAGISKPMVYAYLGTKEELFIACLHREGARLLEAIAHAVTAAPATSVEAASVEATSAEEQLWRGLRAFLGFVGAHRDGWSVLYRQARGQEPFAEVLDQLRSRMVELVARQLAGVIAAEGRQARESEILTMAYALVGGAEAVADWLADQPEEEPDTLATRLMNVIWLGAAATLRGERWRP